MSMRLVPVQFASALRAARTIRGFTRREVSAATGLPVWRLASLERGEDTPGPQELGRLWDFLTTDPPETGPAETAT